MREALVDPSRFEFPKPPFRLETPLLDVEIDPHMRGLNRWVWISPLTLFLLFSLKVFSKRQGPVLSRPSRGRRPTKGLTASPSTTFGLEEVKTKPTKALLGSMRRKKKKKKERIEQEEESEETKKTSSFASHIVSSSESAEHEMQGWEKYEKKYDKYAWNNRCWKWSAVEFEKMDTYYFGNLIYL